jgi:TusA-related sulfurtransferase
VSQRPVGKVVDGRGLEPPGPFELTMAALDAIDPGESVLLLLPREPHPLYQVLDRQGFLHRTQRTPDGGYEIRIWRPQ